MDEFDEEPKPEVEDEFDDELICNNCDSNAVEKKYDELSKVYDYSCLDCGNTWESRSTMTMTQ